VTNNQMSPQESIEQQFERYGQILGAQAELYRALISLAKKQAGEIAERHFEQFVYVLDEKRKILQEIESLELSSMPLRDLWESENHQADDRIRLELRDIVEEIRALLEELLRVESACQQELGNAKERVEEELRHISAGPKVISSYRGRNQCKPRFMNEIG